MSNFEGIQFKGTFRDYQQRVLDNVDKYLEDGRINIVAAPGSGKTVLGLELVRRLGEPCLILSPTTAIREQWGQRFKELFLNEESCFEEFFSMDLHSPRLLNSITYQALYKAMEHIPGIEDGEVNYSNMDLMKTLKRQGIKTICLDEAHHLRKEWQKALEKFLERLDEDTVKISLTATPPYDAEETEWNRYFRICGEIDEEIFVPELVAQGNLCPHQDYVYFNYPSSKEEQAFLEHKENVRKALETVGTLECISEVADFINRWNPRYEYAGKLVKKYREELEALLVLLRYYGKIPDIKKAQKMIGRKILPKPEEIYFQRALQFLLEEGTRFCEKDHIEALQKVLQKYHLYQNKKVTIILTEELRKALISSVGKLKSIGDITIHEYQTLGKNLHMLILTDFNRGTPENLSKIGTGESYHDISVVSIFETLRRLDDTMNVGVLSGSLIFLPQELVPQGTMVSVEPFAGTRYARVEVYGSQKEGMELVSALFRQGKLQVLVGTKALLGEGWDEPCINALILASFVGTFVSSNQMRGRAIRTNPIAPDKTANIWHLVTLEPEDVVKESVLERLVALKEKDRNQINSCDFDVVKKRFDYFMAPNYESGEIESGIDRLTLIRPPYDANGILRINREMLELSEDRDKMSKMWKGELVKNPFRVVMETALPIESSGPSFRYLMRRSIKIVTVFWLLTLLMIGFLATIGLSFFVRARLFGVVITMPIFLLFLVPVICSLWKDFGLSVAHKVLLRMLRHRSSVGSLDTIARVLQKTLVDCLMIAPGASVVVGKGNREDGRVKVQLKDATIHDQNVFNRAMGELMSPIDNPRYLLVPKKAKAKDKYQYSLPCPSAIGQKKSYVKVLEKYLAENLGFMEAVYTGNGKGKALLEKCQEACFMRRGAGAEEEKKLLEADTKYIVVKEAKKALEDKGEKKKNG